MQSAMQTRLQSTITPRRAQASAFLDIATPDELNVIVHCAQFPIKLCEKKLRTVVRSVLSHDRQTARGGKCPEKDLKKIFATPLRGRIETKDQRRPGGKGCLVNDMTLLFVSAAQFLSKAHPQT